MHRAVFRPLILALLVSLVGCGSQSSDPVTPATTPVERAQTAAEAPAGIDWAVQFDTRIPAAPRTALVAHLQSLGYAVTVMDDGTLERPASSVFWAVGDTPLAQVIRGEAPTALAAEAYEITTRQAGTQQLYLTRGNDGDAYDLTPSGPRIGDLYAAYALLEQLGMRFLHPLAPTVTVSDTLPNVERSEAPRWPIRAWHIHTQHPLELTHVLNAWGPEGPDDEAGWQALLPEWERFLEWSVANGQNRVEWFLLMADSWQTFADSPERQARLKVLVDMAHQWGLAVGIDAPIAFKQQHAWTMLRTPGNETAQIRSAVDWLMVAGFDYLEIEMGFSEFTHPNDEQMLEWMNEATRYTADTYGKPTYVKVHCTQNQTAEHFQDPESGEPLNFNFLPYYADTRLGVLPHTVQYYDLEGPVFTYGNDNFHYLRRYMQMEAGRREVVYYPETAYWVNFDIDVPLFLPVYAQSRLNDLRLIANDERQGNMGRGEHAGAHIQGQVNFSSGWEWGYWLNDVVTARAAWNPQIEETDNNKAFATALQPFTSTLGPAADQAAVLIQAWSSLQKADLWEGKPNAEGSAVSRNGQAYLQGWDTWSEVAKTLKQLETQPRKMGMLDMINPFFAKDQRVPYGAELKPLLASIATQSWSLYEQFAALESQVPASGLALYSEIRDAMEITALRAEQVYELYETLAHQNLVVLNADQSEANQHLNNARKALDRASTVVARREAHYRAAPERIAAWDYNPTAYNFGYLWTVHSLYFWWRDEGKAVDRPVSPGYLNFKDPVDIANGEGEWVEMLVNFSWLREQLAKLFPPGQPFEEMLYEPDAELLFPQEGLRERPFWYVPLAGGSDISGS